MPRLRRPTLRDHGVPSQLLRLVIVGMVVASEARRIGVLLDLGASIAVHVSYFTVQASLLTGIVAVWLIAQPAERRPPSFDWLRGATTSWALLAGVTYVTVIDPGSLLSPTTEFSSLVQHQFVPMAMLLDWLLVPGRTRTPVRRSWTWLLYPGLYATVALVIANRIGAWLYPFMNPVVQDGWWGVAVQTSGVLGLLVLIVVLVAAVAPRGTDERRELAPSRPRRVREPVHMPG